MYIKRNISFPENSFFLFGPRGTGKTMMLKKRFPDALYIDLLRPDVYLRYLTHPEYLIETIKGADNKLIIIDEIQKIPKLLDVVHLIIEEQNEVRFILTGSSARKLRKSASNLLGGRVLSLTMSPFSAKELGPDYSFEKMLKYGMIPLVVMSKTPEESLAAYIDLYLREEIFNEGLTRNIENFSRVLETLSFSHASLLNTSNIARESSVARKTVESYIMILKDLLIADTLPVFSKRAQRQVISRSKFYFFDTGLFRYLRPKGVLDANSEIEGTALEGLVYQHLKSRSSVRQKKDRLYFWRTKSKTEVDFILYGETAFKAFEIKNGKTVRPADLKGLKTFHDEYPEAELHLLYRGTDTFVRDNIKISPINTSLLSTL